MSMNKVFLIGNLVRDPEYKTTPNGTSVCNFTLAVQRKYDRERQADFIPVVCWRSIADVCGRHTHKGMKVAVAGEIRTRSYDAQDGGKRHVTEVLADEVTFLDRKDSRENKDAQAYDMSALPDLQF